MTLKWLAVAAMTMCAGCALMKEGIVDTSADEEDEGGEVVKSDDGMVCRLEAPTGSNRRRKVCYSSQPSTFQEKDAIESTLGQRGTNVPPVSGSAR